MKAVLATALLIGLLDLGTARAQTYEPFSKWRIEASLPLQYGSNTFLAPTDARSDFYASPSVRLSALGSLDSSLNYQIYLGGNPDVHARLSAADDGAAVAGGRISKTFGDFAGGTVTGGAIYNHNLVFDGAYRKLLFQADDFSGYVGYGYANKAAGFSFAPSFMTTYRLADLTSQDRFLFILKADLNQELFKNLILTLTPTLRHYVFIDGTAAGKRNTFPSIVGAITYKLSDDLSVAGSVEYDRRWSNRTGNNFENVTVSASINYAHDYIWPGTKRAP